MDDKQIGLAMDHHGCSGSDDPDEVVSSRGRTTTNSFIHRINETRKSFLYKRGSSHT